jgi:hypothetical protein
MKLRNIILVLKDQMPFSRFIRNLRKGHLLGILSKRSHSREDGKPKVMYNTKPSAQKAAESMSKKREVHFSNYKCIWCDGYHLGKNRENKTPV